MINFHINCAFIYKAELQQSNVSNVYIFTLSNVYLNVRHTLREKQALRCWVLYVTLSFTTPLSPPSSFPSCLSSPPTGYQSFPLCRALQALPSIRPACLCLQLNQHYVTFCLYFSYLFLSDNSFVQIHLDGI